MSANGTITVGYEGAYYTITVKTSDTIDDTLTTLAGLGISGSIKDGKLTLTGYIEVGECRGVYSEFTERI